MNVKIDMNVPDIVQKKRKILSHGLTLIRDEIIEDQNTMVPIQGGVSHNGGGGSLQQSAFLHSSKQAFDCKIHIRWNTPYAHYQHQGLVMHGPVGNRTYGPKKLTYTSATARSEWTKHAAEVYKDDWAKKLQKVIGGK